MDAGGDEDGPSIWSYLIFCTAFILVIIFLLSTFFNIDFNDIYDVLRGNRQLNVNE